jgi:hypothetical protein
VNADQVQAELRDGILTLDVPKKPEAQPKRISVRPGKGEAAGDGGRAGEKAKE